MTITNAVSSADVAIQPKGSAQRSLGQADFLALMTTQLKQQDPFDPVDNQAMIAQMAQFSSLAGISEMNDTLKAIADRMGEQTAILNDIRDSGQSSPTSI